MKAVHEKANNWWAILLCVLALFGALYILILAGAPIAVAVLVLVGACLSACGIATLTALRIRGKVDKAFHDRSHRAERD